MPKKVIDPVIMGSIKTAAFGSFSDNIKMLPYQSLRPHKENFYPLTEIELLAEDIERQGIKSNLVVREDETEKGNYIIISGHRRHKAVGLLIEQKRNFSNYLPCLINPAKSPDEELQDLIMLNATARTISDGLMLAQYEKLKAIFEAKKANGESVRMREKIAEVLGVSTGQVAKIENIVKNASPEVKNAVKDDNMSISAAHQKTNKSLPQMTTKKKNSPPLSQMTTKKKSSPPLSQMTTKNEDVPKQDCNVVTNDNEFPCFSTDVIAAFNRLDLSRFYLNTEEKEEFIDILIKELKAVKSENLRKGG